MQTSRRFLPIILLIATGIVLGASTNLAKIAADAGLPPLAYLAWSITGAALILLVVGVVRQTLPSLNARTVEYFLVAAFVTVAGSNLIFVSAVPKVGASFVALAIAFPPLLTYLGALALRVERFSMVRAGGVVLALAGAVILAMNRPGFTGGQNSRRIARYGTDTKEEDHEAVFT
jgi:drug/metabolite transporter (DMT)-like permease